MVIFNLTNFLLVFTIFPLICVCVCVCVCRSPAAVSGSLREEHQETDPRCCGGAAENLGVSNQPGTTAPPPHTHTQTHSKQAACRCQVTELMTKVQTLSSEVQRSNSEMYSIKPVPSHGNSPPHPLKLHPQRHTVQESICSPGPACVAGLTSDNVGMMNVFIEN